MQIQINEQIMTDAINAFAVKNGYQEEVDQEQEVDGPETIKYNEDNSQSIVPSKVMQIVKVPNSQTKEEFAIQYIQGLILDVYKEWYLQEALKRAQASAQDELNTLLQ